MNSKVIISSGSDRRLADWLEQNGCAVEPFGTHGIVSEPLSCHPDMFMCKMGVRADADVIRYREDSVAQLSPEYPGDIPFNAACTGKYFIHNLKYTAPELISCAEALDMKLVNVKQGYAKCSTVTVDEDSIITYDRGIEKACRAAGMNVLLVSPGHILLPGYDTGFIGGASGRVNDTVVFNGDLGSHPDCDAVTEFVESRGLSVKWFPEWPLADIGSIIQIH